MFKVWFYTRLRYHRRGLVIHSGSNIVVDMVWLEHRCHLGWSHMVINFLITLNLLIMELVLLLDCILLIPFSFVLNLLILLIDCYCSQLRMTLSCISYTISNRSTAWIKIKKFGQIPHEKNSKIQILCLNIVLDRPSWTLWSERDLWLTRRMWRQEPAVVASVSKGAA